MISGDTGLHLPGAVDGREMRLSPFQQSLRAGQALQPPGQGEQGDTEPVEVGDGLTESEKGCFSVFAHLALKAVEGGVLQEVSDLPRRPPLQVGTLQV